MPLSNHKVIFGGSFNPPTFGHLTACHWLLETLGAYEVIIVPTYEHAFDKQLISFEHRLEMCALTFPPTQDYNYANNVIVSGIEYSLPKPNRTIDTLKYMINVAPNRKYALAIGSDLVAEFPKWHQYEEILKLAKVVVIGRSGHNQTLNFPHYSYPISISEISSTDIRNRIKAGQDITGLVSKSVKDYIKQHDLYE